MDMIWRHFLPEGSTSKSALSIVDDVISIVDGVIMDMTLSTMNKADLLLDISVGQSYPFMVDDVISIVDGVIPPSALNGYDIINNE